MKKALSLLSFAFLLIACGSYNTNNTSVKKAKTTASPVPYAETITASDLKTLLYTYASDEFQGRETGQPGQKMAVNFIKEHYKADNIPAAKSNGDYFQEVPLEVLTIPDVNFSVNGNDFNIVRDFLSILPSKSTSINTNSMVYLGYGIEDANYSDYKDLDVKDKIVLYKSGEPQNSEGIYSVTGTKTPSKWSNNRQQFSAKKDLAMAKGAKAVLFYYPERYFGLTNRYGRNSSKMTLANKGDDLLLLIANTSLAKALVSDIETNNTPKIINTKIALNYKANAKPLTSENVAAIIKGSEKPNEYIIISAHLDHEGVKAGEVYNGADDDGSGTVAILEIAEAFAKAKAEGNGPKRSIVFLNVTAEEKGLLGSKHYTDVDPIFPLADTVADLNIDMIGRTDPKRVKRNRNYLYLIGSDKLSKELHNVSEAVNTKYMNIDLDYTFNADNDPNRFYYRSDHYNFAKNNIPVIFYFNGTHEDYHQPGDTPDKIQYDLLENRTRLIFYTAWELANRATRVAVD